MHVQVCLSTYTSSIYLSPALAANEIAA